MISYLTWALQLLCYPGLLNLKLFKKQKCRKPHVQYNDFIMWDVVSLIHLPLDKMTTNSQTIFSNAFSWMNNFVFSLKFLWCLFIRSQSTLTSIGLNYGLKPNRRQPIIWTTADQIHWRIYASLGGDSICKSICKTYDYDRYFEETMLNSAFLMNVLCMRIT